MGAAVGERERSAGVGLGTRKQGDSEGELQDEVEEIVQLETLRR